MSLYRLNVLDMKENDKLIIVINSKLNLNK